MENGLTTHPAVAEAAIIGVPDDIWGEQVHAVGVLRPDANVTADELTAHARRSLTPYKVPKACAVRTDPLPLSGALKPLKRELRRQYPERRATQAPGAVVEE